MLFSIASDASADRKLMQDWSRSQDCLYALCDEQVLSWRSMLQNFRCKRPVVAYTKRSSSHSPRDEINTLLASNFKYTLRYHEIYETIEKCIFLRVVFHTVLTESWLNFALNLQDFVYQRGCAAYSNISAARYIY